MAQDIKNMLLYVGMAMHGLMQTEILTLEQVWRHGVGLVILLRQILLMTHGLKIINQVQNVKYRRLNLMERLLLKQKLEVLHQKQHSL